MDSELWLSWLDQVAHYYHSLPLYPLFSSVHFILTAVALRREPGSVQFAFRHPVASCVMTFVVASSGGLLANALVGRPPLECLANGWSVLVGVLSWYLIFFSPLDMCAYLCTATPILLLLYTVEELGRAKKIMKGVVMASQLYPQSLVAMAIVGMVLGSGKSWGITLFRLIYKPESASNMELKKISLTTKLVLCAALVFALNTSTGHNSPHPYYQEHHILVAVALTFTLIRYRTLLLADNDPLNSVQHVLWSWATLLTSEPPTRSGEGRGGGEGEGGGRGEGGGGGGGGGGEGEGGGEGGGGRGEGGGGEGGGGGGGGGEGDSDISSVAPEDACSSNRNSSTSTTSTSAAVSDATVRRRTTKSGKSE